MVTRKGSQESFFVCSYTKKASQLFSYEVSFILISPFSKKFKKNQPKIGTNYNFSSES